MPRILRREAAKRDLISHFAYIGEHAGIATAERFLDSARQSFTQLSRMPGIGIPGKFRRRKFFGVRLWPVRSFERYLIVYRFLSDGIVVERVIHSAQDYRRVLGQ